jgi:transcriptional regulator with XRE-family HTH domain
MIFNEEPIINKEATGKRIKRLMRDNDVGIEEVLEVTGVGDMTVNSWFRGETVPSLINLLKIARMCDCEIIDILVVKWVASK